MTDEEGTRGEDKESEEEVEADEVTCEVDLLAGGRLSVGSWDGNKFELIGSDGELKVLSISSPLGRVNSGRVVEGRS